MGGVASVPTDRTRPLKVIGAGYSRSGTLSMAMALEELLDGPVMHGGSQLLGREDAYIKLWSDIFSARAERPRLLKLLREATAGFVAITDAPGNCFVEELLEIYPEAEVICVSRDREKWWASWETVTKQAGAGFLNWFLAPVPGKRWYPKLVTQFLEQQHEKFGPMTPARLEEHNRYVQQVTPSDKFHMMDLSEGWAPLCGVLEFPVPAKPFPRVNDADAVKELELQILREAGVRWLFIFGIPLIIVTSLLTCFK
ncbi:hypothetical protein FGADI_12114 [Fusarium gaditjirri]|uniref:P-loop containing nucleoside triphosphate hydrolase protein n=1 Tax=Fusarium gaditjirri TaxID=282569 RepID=A0A8H4WPK1_9HYPO|nr:hypothetical protein FGADI_12114 [Fusarium gaditjirri]